MRHAIRIGFCLTLAAAFLAPAASRAAQTVDEINGIGLIDYNHKPTFKVGDWARYRMTGKSDMGMKDDYLITVLIAGDVDWWGERCFWVETWTQKAGRPDKTSAALMAYAIFADTLPIQRMKMYQRKVIVGLKDDGTVHEEISRSAAGALKSRTLFRAPLQWNVDTLGVDTVVTPKGTFQTTKVSTREGTGSTAAGGDSTIYTEVRENRTTFYTPQVPITHIAREDVESIIARKTWMVGRSAEGTPLNIRDRGLGSARLVDFGHGLEPRLVPKSAVAAAAKPGAKSAGRR